MSTKWVALRIAIPSMLALALLWLSPVAAREAPQRPNAIGVGLGESTGIGLLYQRTLADGWRGRLHAGVVPTNGPYPYNFTSLGGGILRDAGTFAGGRLYVLGTGHYKQVSMNEGHTSLTPGVGLQWGPVLVETGTSFYSTNRWNLDGSATSITWGVSLSFGLGLVWEF